jgi:UDP-GlcNAc:undecaprenyl-phosphate/decaprenyl-phosphate GlcNAc-1-phosphate transferase|tara:strand:- start:4654 stop:5694 length:1041 start_codon:yes stop_codon:yes gene_type:complete
MNISLISIIVTFLLTILAITFLRRLALKINLVDFPGQRKVHSGSVPLIGGLSMFVGIFFGLLVFPTDKDLIAGFLFGMFILVALGILDDYRNISVSIRFIFQGFAALIMIHYAGVSIESIGNLNGTGEILLQKWAVIFSLIAVIGSINAINMMDGIHGLAGGQSLITFVAIAFLTFINNSYLGFSIALVFCFSLIPFLVENLCIGRSEDKRIFMGDAGSMMLGFGIVWLLVENSQGPSRSFAPATALWVFSIPLMDFFSTILRRLLKKQSPFRPDRGHFHHILIEKGFSDLQSLIIILILTLVIAIVGIVGELLMVSEWKMFYSFIALFVTYSLYTFYSWKKVKPY